MLKKRRYFQSNQSDYSWRNRIGQIIRGNRFTDSIGGDDDCWHKKKAYKVAEILDKRYKESLEQANVEEIYLEDEFTRIMLSNGSHGVGITRVINEWLNFKNTSLRTRSI
ncbi:MAG: hypothetical protein MJE63_26125 [Proteobacteria bacterium]|nr:hypothetical protein [Pseudomonadota bacterium]